MSEGRDRPDRVLVVDDDHAFLDYETEVLEAHGLSVAKATSAEQALEILRSDPDISLALIDVVLEGTSGLDLCRTMKADGELGNIPVMFVTGRVQPDNVGELFGAGGDEFSLKPFRVEEFMVRVQAMLRLAKRGRDLTERAVSAEKLAQVRTTERDEMRRFAEAVVANLAAGVAVVDSHLQVLFANEAFCGLMSVDAAEATGGDLSKILGRKMAKEIGLPGIAAKVASSGEGEEVLGLRRGGAGGAEQVLDLRLRPVLHAGSTHTMLIFQDVTDRWRAQEAIRIETERLQDVVNAIGAGLSRIDRHGQFLWTNPTFDEWFGAPGGRAMRDIFELPEKIDIGAILDSCFCDNCFETARWERLSGGTTRYFENVFAPIRDEHGDVFEVLILSMDITDVSSRIEQLTLIRELGSVILGSRDLERVLALILTCVTAGHALEFNRAFLFLVDREQRTLEGRIGVGPADKDEAYRIWGELSHKGYSLQSMIRSFNAAWEEARTAPLTRLVEGRSYSLEQEDEILVRTANENELAVVEDAPGDPRVTDDFRKVFRAKQFAVVPLAAKGEVVGVILADNLYNGRPITQEHIQLLDMFAQQAAIAINNAAAYTELGEKLNIIREQAEQLVRSEKLAAIGRMAAHVAHEIRNPLVTIGGFARAIFRHPDRVDRNRSNAWIIAEEVTRLEEMLAGVMDFTKPAKPVKTDISINKVITSTCESLEEMLTERHIGIEIELAPELPDVAADEKQMRQVLLNLINNAVDSMPDGGSLVVTTEHDEQWLRATIKDTGLGIPPEIIPRLFNPFFTTKTGGTGLGLAVTQKILEDHGGRIDVASDVGSGTTFTVWLPIMAQREPRALVE